MKLLIITQKMDMNDPVLGFFHRWVEELSKHFESIIVICLEKGIYDVPANVIVLSLGKEKRHSRLQYIIRLYRHIWNERKNYDTVFVHMNQEYVLIGGLVWKVLRKNIYLWRNHPVGNILTRMAVFLSKKVFCTSPYSFTAQFKKTFLMPVGIDTDYFYPDPSVKRKDYSLLFLGRIAPIKRVHEFVTIVKKLRDEKILVYATIVGSALPRYTDYYEEILKDIEVYNLKTVISILPAVRNTETAVLYRSHEVYLNLSPPGSFDKTIFEAMAVGTLAVYQTPYPYEEVKRLLALSSDEKKVRGKALREYVIQDHSLKKLAHSLVDHLLAKETISA